MVKVAVIGAGVIGISTALHLKKTDPSLDVKIIAKAFSPNTCTDVAAGIWLPFVLRDTPMSLQRKWTEATLGFINNLLATGDGSDLIKSAQGHELFDCEEITLPEWHDLMPEMKILTKEEMKQFPEKFRSGWFLSTYIIGGSPFSQWLMKSFLRIGGDVEKRTINSFEELADSFDIVINCCGFGARKLCNDTMVQPVRGQVMRVKAPWVKNFILAEWENERGSCSYIIPNQTFVVIGGTTQLNNFNTEVNETDKKNIIRESQLLQPDLINALHLKDVVGLRPSRASVRLEREIINLSGNDSKKVLQVIHNYGHGGSGLTIFWGCALDAVDLAMTCINEMKEERPIAVSKL